GYRHIDTTKLFDSLVTDCFKWGSLRITQLSGEFDYPYSDDAFFVRNHAASSRPLHNGPPSPEPPSSGDNDQQQISSAAAREVSQEMDALAMALYASSPTRPAPTSTYGTPSEDPPSLPNPHGGE
ncbi:hypothetical protein FRC07_014304, partial [Ceratobasidium sp. 392]